MSQIQIQTNTNEVGQTMLEKYHEGGLTPVTFAVSVEDPPVGVDPVPEVRGVTLTYENGG